MKLDIEYLKIGDISEYENNARRHEEADVHAIAKSIEEFGFSDPIGIWGKANTIVEGHGRYLAALELGLQEVPVIRLDHLTDDERRAYALAHNKTAELSSWDFGQLEEELNNIDIDMSDFGFDSVSEEGFGEDFTLPSGEKEPFTQMTFVLADEQAELIKTALRSVKGQIVETFGNENGNGNALYEVVREWVSLKK